MSIETPEDLDGLREAGRVVHITLEALEQHAAPGVTTAALDRVAADIFRKHGARSAPALVYGFPGAVLISVNDEVVHGIPGPRRLSAGDIVKLDVTVEKNGYMADAARTVVVGPAADVALQLTSCAQAAFDAALDVARAGHTVSEIGRAIDREVRRVGFRVVRGLEGHGIGRTIHEPPSVPNEYDPHATAMLTEGLVLAIEPMICAGSGRPVLDKDGWTIRTADGSLAAHHEHTLVITAGAPLILTGGLT